MYLVDLGKELGKNNIIHRHNIYPTLQVFVKKKRQLVVLELVSRELGKANLSTSQTVMCHLCDSENEVKVAFKRSLFVIKMSIIKYLLIKTVFILELQLLKITYPGNNISVTFTIVVYVESRFPSINCTQVSNTSVFPQLEMLTFNHILDES